MRRIKWLKTRAQNLYSEANRAVQQRQELRSWHLYCQADILLARACKLEGIPYTGPRLCEELSKPQ